VPDAWSDATVKPVQREIQDPTGTFWLSKEPKVDHLPPSRAAAALIGQKLSSMQAVLALEFACHVPQTIFTKKYFRMRLANGQIAGTVSSSEEPGERRRGHLVRVPSHVRQAGRRGRGEVRAAVNVDGAVHHFAVVLIDGRPTEFAFAECVQSSANRDGLPGLPQKRCDRECFTSLGGRMRYVNAMVIDAVVGTLFVRARLVVTYSRAVFSAE